MSGQVAKCLMPALTPQADIPAPKKNEDKFALIPHRPPANTTHPAFQSYGTHPHIYSCAWIMRFNLTCTRTSRSISGRGSGGSCSKLSAGSRKPDAWFSAALPEMAKSTSCTSRMIPTNPNRGHPARQHSPLGTVFPANAVTSRGWSQA